ncbi:RHS repeat domain-containing protein [Spirosoma aerophilum]
MPGNIYLLESVPGTFTSAPYVSSPSRYIALGSGNTIGWNVNYALRLTFNQYNANGYLLRYSVSDGPSTAYQYTAYAPAGGIPFSLVTTQITNDGLATAQSTTYGYQQPMLGPATVTDPRGVITRYQYDTFGRLLSIRDKDNYILKNYTYHYPTGQ